MPPFASLTFLERAASTVRAFAADDAANAYSEYALVASTFAMLMIAMMTLVQTAAAGQLAFTDSSLDNRNGISP